MLPLFCILIKSLTAELWSVKREPTFSDVPQNLTGIAVLEMDNVGLSKMKEKRYVYA
jgi:hypothetical protein